MDQEACERLLADLEEAKGSFDIIVDNMKEEGIEYPWAEYLDMKLRDFKEELEDNYRLMERISACKEVLEENPENVTEG